MKANTGVASIPVERLARGYLRAKEYVLRMGFADEIDWQDDLSFDRMQERDFLREGAWVILSAGMRETVIRRKFEVLTPIFCEWKSACAIVSDRKRCRKKALSVFGHVPKIDAILELAHRVSEQGFEAVQARIREEGVSYLKSFPYIGPVTAYHLAKNLGLDVVKADRHLVRFARATGYETPDALCREIAAYVAEKLAVIDLVLWRYATLDPKYLKLFDLPD
jgi:hypothetical protein